MAMAIAMATSVAARHVMTSPDAGAARHDAGCARRARPLADGQTVVNGC
jgi:hypothetical protein